MIFGVVKKYSKTEIDNKTAGQIAVLDAYGRKHGLSFIVVDSIGEGDTRANGTYVGKNKVLISLDAEGGALLSVAGHEVYHYIARNNKLDADSIKAFVLDKLKNNANYDYEFEFNKLVKSYGTENVDEIEEEMVANAMFELLSDEDVINDLAKENPTLLEKIIAAIKDFIKELKKMAKKLPWAEVAVFQDDIQSLETIKAMAETALWNIKENGVISSENANKSTASDVSNNASKVSNSGKNVSNTEKKNTAEEDGVKMSFSSIPTKDILDNNIVVVSKMKSIIDLSGNEFLKSNKDLISQVEDYFNSIGNLVKTTYGVIELKRTGIKSSIAHGIGRNKAIAFKAVPEVLKNGKIVDYQINWKNRGYDTAVFAAPITIAKQEYFLAAVVIVEKTKNSYYLHEVALQKKGDNAMFKTGTVNDGTSSKALSPIQTILQKLVSVNTQYMQELNKKYLTAVKTGDMEAAQKLVDKAAERAGYNSPLLYHGTKAFGFTEFDLEKMDDKTSIFLTSNPK